MAARLKFLDDHYFLFRRLHSLTGIVPIGVFLINHLLTNSSILWGVFNTRARESGEGAGPLGTGVATFQEEVTWLNELPLLLIIEITLWVSIAFHAVLGVYYARTGRFNNQRYAYQDNWRYSLQRITGYIAIFFIFYHLATLRWGWAFLVPGGAEWSHHYAASTLAMALRGGSDGITVAGLAVSLFYFVGITSSVFHFANGLWTAAITWGLTISAGAQRRWGYACAAIGAGMMAMAWGALVGFVLLDPAEARKVEDRLLGKEALVEPDPAGELNGGDDGGNIRHAGGGESNGEESNGGSDGGNGG